MSADPYRDEDALRHEALLADERALLVRAGRMMVWAGAIGLLAVVVGLGTTLMIGGADLVVSVGLPAVFSALTLRAGLVLARLPGGSRDYGEIERAVRSLGVVYIVKGVIVLTVIGLF
ncbi:MAG: hypothetical protein IAG13_08740, partial [Deltaproteobacteria bacterium]|nr:hypothetical protein [Nannocystaceae bacterium]